MAQSKRNNGHQKGAQDHAEGQHGEKTRNLIADAWNHPGADASAGGANAAQGETRDQRGPRYDEAEREAHDPPSGSHLFTDRTQHDEADLNAEKTRQVRDAERHGHIGDDELSQRSARAAAKRKT